MYPCLTLLISLAAVPANAYIWPSPQLDALESARFDQSGFNAGPLASFIQPCDQFLFGVDTGRADTADWIRTAYHDMATHNITDGTGGLDASIRFDEEQARAENAGDGFSNTMLIVFIANNRYVSLADTIALAALIAVENCRGPEIAFRGGRADAAEPNAPGVPEPEQGLDSHIASFARQGFTQTEMIGLVACGHTFGGVQHDPFPDIVGELNDANSTEDVAHFDSTFATFDNNVAKEYILGTTQNPLVVGFNDTTNSDKRIFGSDGNVTMSSFANSLELYTSTCADLFARMLDTVPRGVQLTDVIKPLPVKPANVELTMHGDTLKLFGQLRLWNMTEDSTRTVRMLWHAHAGGRGKATLGFSGTSSSTGGKYTAVWYGFNASDSSSFLSLDATAGIKSLSFVVDGNVEDQGGLGFAVQNSFMFSETSCLTSQNPFTGKLDFAVRNGVNLTRLYLEQLENDSAGRRVIVELDIPPPTHAVAANSAYSLWTLNSTAFAEFNIGAEIDGVKYSTNVLRSIFDLPSCPGASTGS
ncbi:putative L-ascorbate oxidase [Mycena latifolia]|nr:putative L-ascorbate oxidase [Mycena latifolia]